MSCNQESLNTEFGRALRALLNEYCRESESNTPDFILAAFLADCLAAFDSAMVARSAWYEPPGPSDAPGLPDVEKA